MNEHKLDCKDCGGDTFYENYMVWNCIWQQAVPEQKGFLCIGCLEARLGRRLVATDFSLVPINELDIRQNYPHLGRKSSRLVRRLTTFLPCCIDRTVGGWYTVLTAGDMG